MVRCHFGALPDDLDQRLAALSADRLAGLQEVALTSDSLASFSAHVLRLSANELASPQGGHERPDK